MRSAILLFLFAFVIHSVLSIGYRQHVVVKGKVFCPSQPNKIAGIKVKLIDEDDGPDPDDLMAQTILTANGEFTLDGFESEITAIEPRLKIYHFCDAGVNPCARKWKIHIPSSYITKEGVAAKTFDIGTWNLEAYLHGEERDCSH